MHDGGIGDSQVSWLSPSAVCDGAKERYKKVLRQLLDDVWNEDELTAVVDQQVQLFESHLSEAQRGAVKAADDIKEFVADRRETVVAEIED